MKHATDKDVKISDIIPMQASNIKSDRAMQNLAKVYLLKSSGSNTMAIRRNTKRRQGASLIDLPFCCAFKPDCTTTF